MAERPIAVVVDDSKPFLMYLSLLLNRMNLEVLPVNNAAEALELSRVTRPHMMTLDMVMPGLSGAETFARMKTINPNIRVLLSSGYSLDGRAAGILERGCDGFIQKPFKMKELSKKIREILDKK